jgi:sugar (pentulose or hexulose) kinase
MVNSLLFCGFDLGTSGARLSIIDEDQHEVYAKAIGWTDSYDCPTAWMQAVDTLLKVASSNVALSRVASICFSGTSASCLLVDKTKGGITPTRAARMYNYDVLQQNDPIFGVKALDLVRKHAPDKHTASSATGSLAKLLAWNEERALSNTEVLAHQSDFCALQFMNDSTFGSTNDCYVSSDWHNCLKLGYDVRALKWPEWMEACLQEANIPMNVLPRTIVSPGAPTGTINPEKAKFYNLPTKTVIVGGTTDSNAAFLAAIGSSPEIGTAVTSLGSTLAIKQLSTEYVEDASVGVYSHRLPCVFMENGTQEAWLVGGASNVGCAILRQEKFSNEELDELSKHIDPTTDSNLEYYPLTCKGERFPVANGEKEAILEPKPATRAAYLHAILQGISDVERDGFLVLGDLGALPRRPTRVLTSGGGARNDMWTQLRQRRLRTAFGPNCTLRVDKARSTEASYGAAILASASFVKGKKK